MSASMYLSSPFDRLEIEAADGSVRIRSLTEWGAADNTIYLRLTSADVAAMRAALDVLDTEAADADCANEPEFRHDQ